MSNCTSILVASALIACASMANAGELIVHAATYHSRPGYDTGHVKYGDLDLDYFAQTGGVKRTETRVVEEYNNSNPGLGYAADAGWRVGVYYNSFRRASVYGSWEFKAQCLPRMECGVTIGMVSGYKQEYGKMLKPLGGLTLSFEVTKNAKVHLLVGPKSGDNTTSLVHLAFGYKL